MTEYGLLAGQLFNGISVASILLLAALGLALSFGLMRVINMAHGEILMMGGYLTYVSLKIFPHGIGYLVGMLVALVGTALFGGLLELTLIRRLYGRPLDTLLATWGVSLTHAAEAPVASSGRLVMRLRRRHGWLDRFTGVAGGIFAGFGLPLVRLILLFALSASVLARLSRY